MPTTSSAPPRVLSVWLERCPEESRAAAVVSVLLDGARPWGGRSLAGLTVLVKPNLLRAVKLACTEPSVVAAACRWLLDQGARVRVADSPGFGSCAGVAQAIGLTAALKPLGLRVEPMAGAVPTLLSCGERIAVAATALEADVILSAAKVKAHSQMRLTLSCKNLYGCVPGLRKAIYHTRQGTDPDRFAAMQASILDALPPVSSLVDGITAMHVDGPSAGKPYPLGLLGASASPVALDEAVCQVLGRAAEDIPLQKAFILARHPDCASSGARHIYPLRAPEDFRADGFQLPVILMHTSFRPLRLIRSCLRRVWYDMFH